MQELAIAGITIKTDAEGRYCLNDLHKTSDGDIDWLITNELDDNLTAQVAQDANEVRWQVEKFHRELKQLTGSGKCQGRKACSQRNHIACCYHHV